MNPESVEPYTKPTEKVIFPTRINQILEDNTDYPTIYNQLINEQIYDNLSSPGRLFDSYTDAAKVLRIARYKGILSPTMDGWFVSVLRGAWGKTVNEISDKKHKSYIKQLQELAQSENGTEDLTREEFLARLQQLEDIADEVRRKTSIGGKKFMNQPLSDDEEKKYQDFVRLRLNLSGDILTHFPATTLSYMYRYGGLGWLWGINDQTPLDEVRNQGGRVGDDQDVNWSDF